MPATRLILALCITLATSRVALAQEEIDEVIVLGTHFEDGSFQTETQLSVDRDELEAMMPAEPEQLLRRLPGLSVYRPGGPGGVSEVFLRGAESNFTAVLVDGVRLNNPSNTRGGSFDLSTLAVNEIRRIDIGFGAMSAIYGSDAMAGVVRIESAWPEAGSRSAYMEAGTENDWKVGAAALFGLGDAADLGVRISSLEGGDEIAGSSLQLDSVSARLTGQRNSGGRWQLNLRHVDRSRTSFPEVSGGPELAVLPDLEDADGEELSVSAMTKWTLSANWEAEIIASWAELKDDIVTPAVPPGELDGQPAFTTDSEYQRGQLLWINRLATGSRSHLAFGFDLIDEEGRDEGAVDLGFATLPNNYTVERTTSSAFLEWGGEWNAGLSSTLAIRLDHTDEKTRTSGKLGLVKEFQTVRSRLWMSAASGFKLPSFFALSNPLVGNPGLMPEKVTSFELGYEQDIGDSTNGAISLFASEYEDLVDFDFDAFTNVNREKIDITGVFFHLQMRLSPTVQIGADAVLSNISFASGQLRRRPEKTGGVNLRWHPSETWSVDVAARYVGERLTTSIPTGDVVDGAYGIAFATARYRHSEKLAMWLAIDNAFNSNHQDSPGFPAPGFGARLGAELRF